METTTRMCVNCKYFEKRDYADRSDGDCARYPPKIVVGRDDNVWMQSPNVRENWWCGEHKRLGEDK